MWPDEIDTLCHAVGFWEVLEHLSDPAVVAERGALIAAPPLDRLECPPTLITRRLAQSRGLLSGVRAILTLMGWNGPLYILLMRPWIGLTGESPFALRSSSLLFGVLAVPLTYVLGRRLFGSKVGVLGATLAAVSPHLVWYSQEAKMYAPILVLGLLAVYALRRAIGQPSGGAKWWVVMVAAITLGIYTHVLAALLIPVAIVLTAIWWRRARRHWRGALISLAVLTLPYLPAMVWQVRAWRYPPGQATLLSAVRLDVMMAATYNAWAGNLLGQPWSMAILAALGLAALFALSRTNVGADESDLTGAKGIGRRYDSADLTGLLAWLLVPLLGIWLISLRQPIFTERYLIWAAPALYLLAAAGVVALGSRGRRGTLLAAALLLVVLVGDGRALWYQADQPIKADFRAAAAYLDERYQPDDLIVFNLAYIALSFDYYSVVDFSSWGAPAAASGSTGPEFDSQMSANTEGYGSVWLVLSDEQTWDPNGLVKAWLDDHAANPPEEKVFARVRVYRYQLED
jgi:mannosyltransferase